MRFSKLIYFSVFQILAFSFFVFQLVPTSLIMLRVKNELTEKEAAGMTVNERLWVANLMNDFDKAIAERNEAEMKAILEKVYLSPENIEAIINKHLKANEQKRGF